MKGSQGERWQKAEVELKLEPPYSVLFFEAEVIDWKYGDIAIDDIEFRNGPCKGYNALSNLSHHFLVLKFIFKF